MLIFFLYLANDYFKLTNFTFYVHHISIFCAFFDFTG